MYGNSALVPILSCGVIHFAHLPSKTMEIVNYDYLPRNNNQEEVTKDHTTQEDNTTLSWEMKWCDIAMSKTLRTL